MRSHRTLLPVLLLIASAALADPAERQQEKSNAELKAQLEELKEKVSSLENSQGLLAKLSGRVGGYLDVGFFSVQGDGSGLRTDVGNVVFPQYAGVVPGSWVFLGDPLATAINSRGEPADTGESRAVVFDAINAGSHP